MSLNYLKNKWEKEKEYYQSQELGTGIHNFVRAFLEDEELFGLKEGSLSTKLEYRRNEYIHENKTKQGRKADFVIYINPEIIIPLEAECYGNISIGIGQLFRYQKDFDKHYGILTDGFIWRFYNNNIYKEFTLDQILAEKEVFLEFWKEYIKPDFYYLSFFEPRGQLLLLEKSNILQVEESKQIFFEDITKLIKSFNSKIKLEGYLTNLSQKEKYKLALEITYAYIIQFILYKTLVDNDFGDFKKEFKEIVKTICECLKVKQYGKILGLIEGISNKISENIYRPFKKEQTFINEKLLNLIRKPRNELHEVSPWLDIFVFIKKYDFSNIQNEIFGYIYENYLKELYQEEKKGQYFTHPAIVNFMLQQIGYSPDEIKKRYEEDKNSISIIDPACGSGTFLYRAVDAVIKAFGNNYSFEKSKLIEEIINNNVFGLDIAEFPLYLAEMSILMRMLPLVINEKYNNPVDKKIKVFLTKDSVAEFMDTALRNTFYDQNVEFSKNVTTKGQIPMFTEKLDLGYKSYVREKNDLEEMKRSLENQPRINRYRFDYVIGNPPYVSYNECSKQKVLIFELMKKGNAKLNNIYGVNLHSIPGNKKKYAPKPNLYAFFIALGIALLKDGGRLCYIIPQTILTAGDLDVLRYHLAKYTTIEKILTFSGKMFVGRGIRQNKPVATSSLIFVISKKTPSQLHQVEIINNTDSNENVEDVLKNILNGKNKKIERKKILQIKLLQNVNNWNFIKQSKKFLDFYEEYKRNTEDISVYYEHSLAQKRFGSRFYFDIGYNINEKFLQKEVIYKGYQYPKLVDEFWTIKLNKGYWPNERKKDSKFQIKLLTTNQGYNLLDTPYKILWSYINPKKFHFSSLPLIWARNQICAIGSKNKEELFYLFAILNSSINQKLLNTFLKTEQEKDLLISLASVKAYIRIPRITENNKVIKGEIIEQIRDMLNLEQKKLSDFVDFSKVMIQKLDRILVENNKLILERGDNRVKLNIKENKELIKEIIDKKYSKKLISAEKIILSQLINLPIIDYKKQQKIKNYIDDLIFALYFNISLNTLGLDKAVEIRIKCAKHPYYKLINFSNNFKS